MGLDDGIARIRASEEQAVSAAEQLARWRTERITPLTELLEDFVGRCREAGIPTESIGRLRPSKMWKSQSVWDQTVADGWPIKGGLVVTDRAEMITAEWEDAFRTEFGRPTVRVSGLPSGATGCWVLVRRSYEPWNMPLGDGWLDRVGEPGFAEQVAQGTADSLAIIEDWMGAYLVANLPRG